MRKILEFSLFFLLLSNPALAVEKIKWIEKTIEVETDEINPTLAKKDLIEKATVKASEDMIKDIIGEAKFSRNRTLIESNVIKRSARYVPFTRPGDLVALPNKGFRLSVNLRISQDDLQSLLLENGLFYESDSTPILLPVVTITDKIGGRSYGWWQEMDPKKIDLAKISRSIESGLKNSFWKNNFYVLRPQSMHYQDLLPSDSNHSFFSFSSSNLDWSAIAGQWNAQILLLGGMDINKSTQRSDAYLIGLHFSATQVLNGRSIAEVTRQYETDGGRMDLVVEQKLREVLDSVCSDLASQVLEAWQKGTIGSSVFRMTVNGRVPLPMQNVVKDAIRQQVREVKNVSERLIAANQLVLEVDTQLTPKEFQNKAPKITMPGYVLTAEDANDKEVTYKFSKERP